MMWHLKFSATLKYFDFFFPSTCLYKTAIVGYIVCTGLKTTMVLKAWYIVVKFQDDPLKIVGKMKVKWSFYGF